MSYELNHSFLPHHPGIALSNSMSYQTVWFLTLIHMTPQFYRLFKIIYNLKMNKIFQMNIWRVLLWQHHWSIHFTCQTIFFHQDILSWKLSPILSFPTSLVFTTMTATQEISGKTIDSHPTNKTQVTAQKIKSQY